MENMENMENVENTENMENLENRENMENIEIENESRFRDLENTRKNERWTEFGVVPKHQL